MDWKSTAIIKKFFMVEDWGEETGRDFVQECFSQTSRIFFNFPELVESLKVEERLLDEEIIII